MNRATWIIGVFVLVLPLTTMAQSRGITLETVESSAQTPFINGVYRALIVGNDAYQDAHNRWPQLETAVSGARAVAQLLSQHYGFDDIEVLENATRRDTLKALERLSKRALPNDSVLVYYAGHGFLDSDSARGFWVPIDAEGVDNTTFLRNSTIRDEMSAIAARARHTLLISDSCFSGTLLRRGTRSISAAEVNEGYFRKVSNKKSVQIIAAGGVEFVDDNYRSSGHSPFTYFLLNELKNNDRQLLTVSELSNNVSVAVANNVEQVPESGVLQGAGDELGEFIFIKMNVSVEGVAPEKVKVEVNVVPTGTNLESKKSQADSDSKPAEVNVDDAAIAVPLPTL
ncbi:MAG: caspase family protein [Gammaproteobacteria bacterium]|nr:caspase family protein [Gammaproteobacteria bacterium]